MGVNEHEDQSTYYARTFGSDINKKYRFNIIVFLPIFSSLFRIKNIPRNMCQTSNNE